MARFRYELQALFDALVARERRAQSVVTRAHAAREATRAVLLSLERSVQELREARPMQTQAWLAAELERAVAALERRHVGQRAALLALEARLEAARSHLRSAAQRRAAVARHRERALADFAALQARRDEEELADANARRGAAGGPLRMSEAVIVLHRPSGHPIVVNADLIETVEAAEDGASVVTLTSGNTVVATESPQAVREAVIDFRRRISAPLG